MRRRFFIKIDLTAVCFTQADDSDGVTANYEDDTKKSLTKQTVSDETVFAVITPLVLTCDNGLPVEFCSEFQSAAMFLAVNSIFLQIEVEKKVFICECCKSQ